jgi:hypothetical protein
MANCCSKGKERVEFFRQRKFIAIVSLNKRKPILQRSQYLTVLVIRESYRMFR